MDLLGPASSEGTPPIDVLGDPRVAGVLMPLVSRTAPVLVAHVDCDETLTLFTGALVDELRLDPTAWVGRQLADVVDEPTVLRLVRQGLHGQAGDDVVVIAGRSWLVAVDPVPGPAARELGDRADGVPPDVTDVTGVVAVLTYGDLVGMRGALSEQEMVREQLTALIELSQDFISLATLGGVVTYVNRAGCELVGLPSQEAAAGLPVEDFLDEDHRAQLPATRRQIKLTGSFQGDNGLRHFVTGDTIPVSMDSFMVTRRSDDRPLAVATVQRDLRTRLAAEQALVTRVKEQRALAELGALALTMSLEELVGEAVRLVSSRYDDVDVEVTEHRPAEGRMVVVAASVPDRAPAPLPVDRTTASGISLLEDRIASSADLPLEDERDPARSDALDGRAALSCPVPGDDRPWGVVAFSSPAPRAWTQDDRAFISSVAATLGAAVRRHELETRLQHQALHDPLTGLPNRTLMLDRITDALDRADGTGATVGVLLLDLDDFKSVNDTLGHVRGDELLTELARRLAAAVGEGGTVARFGGDEFVVLFEDVTDRARVEVVAQDLLDACASGVRIEGVQLTLSGSAGVTLRRSGDGTATSLLSEADIAMYQAKRDRPGSARFYDDAMRQEVVDRLGTAGELRRAVEGGRITVAYQPIVGLPSGELVAMEALARWTNESGRAVSPEMFISVAEQTGLIDDLGAQVLRIACAEATRWQDRGPVGLRVNASPNELRDPRYADRVSRVLAETGFPAHLLGIEITESAFVEEDTGTQDTLVRLREAGVSLLIDDFGTGYSSLSYLGRFSVVDIVKVDRSFLAQGAQGVAVVQAVVALGRAFGLQVCVEGVETPEQQATVTELGCNYAQGFLLGRPLAAERARAVIAGWPGTSGPGAADGR